MRNAPRALIPLMFVAGLAACHQTQPNSDAQSNGVSIDNNASTPAEVEALPADESSATPSNQLVYGDDGPDVNADGNDNSD